MLKQVGVVAGICSVGFLGYCVYFDYRRRRDPDFKKNLKKRNYTLEKSILNAKDDNVFRLMRLFGLLDLARLIIKGLNLKSMSMHSVRN